MPYRDSSYWNDINELRCLVVFKTLQEAGFPRGKQSECCRELSDLMNISSSSISAKICNFKSIAGIDNHSNASENTIRIYKQHGQLSARELEGVLVNQCRKASLPQGLVE